MPSIGDPYTSGNWVVTEGKEKEFVDAWKELLRWSQSEFPDFGSAFLIQQDDDPRHFISVGAWGNKDTVAKWRGHPDFPAKLGAARSLCDDFAGLDYTVVASAEA